MLATRWVVFTTKLEYNSNPAIANTRATRNKKQDKEERHPKRKAEEQGAILEPRILITANSVI